MDWQQTAGHECSTVIRKSSLKHGGHPMSEEDEELEDDGEETKAGATRGPKNSTLGACLLHHVLAAGILADC